jgi:enoyl-CoA hydratase
MDPQFPPPFEIDYSKYQFLTVETGADGVCLLTMNDPDKLNSVGPHNHWELEHIWVDIARDERIKTIVFTGAGRAFSAGGDIKKMAERALTEYGLKYALRVPQNTLRLFEHMLLCPQPIIAAVNGDAIGLGTTLALFSDMSVVSETARLGDTHTKVGMVAGDGGAVVWPLLVGHQKAKEYLMRGKLLRGREAAEMGLVNYAFPAEEVVNRALEIAREIAAQPIWAVRWSKASVNKQLKAQLNQILELSIAYESMTMLTHDYHAAANAFANKQTPVFKGY